MNGGGGHAPPPNGGEFLLQLLRKPHNSDPSSPLSLQTFSHDPAVAAVAPTVPTFLPPHAAFQSNARDLPYRLWDHSSPPFAPHSYFQQNPNLNPNLNPEFSSPPIGFNYSSHQVNPPQPTRALSVEEPKKFGFLGDNSNPSLVHHQDQNIIFGSINRDVLQSAVHQMNSFGTGAKVRGNSINRGKQLQSRNYGSVAPPPGFSSKRNNGDDSNYRHGRRTSDHNVENGRSDFRDLGANNMPINQACSTGQLTRNSPHSISAVDIEESRLELHGEDGEDSQELRDGALDKSIGDRERSELDDLENHLVASLGLEEKSGEKKDTKNNHRDKDYRSDDRGQWIMGQRMRNQKSYTACPNNIHRLNTPFLALFESLIPADEEKLKQKQLMTLLENVVSREWPDARLYVYGSCANSFGFPKSDIDVCLLLELGTAGKSNVLLKLADMLLSENLENVQALTRARVPIVKLMDPVTGISCDICVNNALAVVNTKLLRDYAKIDVRLRQLAFIVKHWAKSRGVNKTYHGTLSSYAYVLMCIHFLQQRRPAILPCLQGMERTYCATVENVDCAFFDQVEKLQNFGSRNGESIAQLVWGFFHYWAYCHDFANDVISVRCGRMISKRDKDWTRRVGNDRHLICIEDPFEVSHDLGRVVDKFSIRVLREEFERAAHIMQNHPNPCVTLFEPYVTD